MNRNTASILIFGVLLISALALPVQAATTFNLNLSKLNPILSMTLDDVEDIQSMAFYGFTDELILAPQTSTTGTFKEKGTVEIKNYNKGGGYIPFFTNGDELQLSFVDLTGTYDNSSGATEITFDPGQKVALNFVRPSTAYMLGLAEFEIGLGSGGFVIDTQGNPQYQTYYLSLTKDVYGLFSGPSDYEAALMATDFFGITYQIAGEVMAVPAPASLVLIGAGFLTLVRVRRKS